jgi:hypothetical protein
MHPTGTPVEADVRAVQELCGLSAGDAAAKGLFKSGDGSINRVSVAQCVKVAPLLGPC